MDLERARDYIGKYAPNPTKAMHVLEDLDAHLKEDAEREQEYALLDATIRRVEAENAKLREDLHQVKRQRDEADDELANLREENPDTVRLLKWNAELTAQRDTLLAALRDLENYSTEYRAKAIARAAIAKVEGETT